MVRRRKKSFTPPVDIPPADPNVEEAVSIHSVDDSSTSPPDRTRRTSSRNKQNGSGTARPSITNGTARRSGRTASSKVVEAALTVSDDSSVLEGEDHLVLEDVDVTKERDRVDFMEEAASEEQGGADDEEDELLLEDVEIAEGQDAGANGYEESNVYADAYENAAANTTASDQEEARPVMYYDGKGQAAGFSISLAAPPKASLSTSAKRKGPIITPRDRQVRLATHKLVVLSVIAHARLRNRMINDDALRDDLYGLVPNGFLEKLRMIHPKKVPVQNERVRQFEAFLRDLVRWWSNKYRLDPTRTACDALRQPNSDMLSGRFPIVGRRVDGWVVESAKEREERQRLRRAAQQELRRRLAGDSAGPSVRRAKGKSRAKVEAPLADVAKAAVSNHPLGEITLFGIGNSTQPTFLRLSERPEVVQSVEDLVNSLRDMSGSREISAQLFAGLCRALGIPSRLVVSVQAPSWSVGASKVTAGATSGSANAGGHLLKRKRAHMAEQERQKRLRTVRRPESVMTSDEESFAGGSMSDRSIEVSVRSLKRIQNEAGRPAARSTTVTSGSVSPATTRAGGAAVRTPESKAGKADDGDGDYRDERWKNIDKPLEVEYVPKLRALKPKALKATEVADEEDDAPPIDLQTPPTTWVEVFSKPWQRWVTVDPIRGLVEPLRDRHMEPSGNDKNNRLVYVVAFEEDGYARDVTARYTRTLHSRVNRMRPPPTKTAGETVDWWPRVVAAFHRPQRLDRDAVEDEELEQASSREPMPTSVAAFKDHPVYALDKHLKRDEVIYPAKQAGTFQGTPVFLRSSVIACKSARQWYNEGRVVKEGEEALKWVKSRGYTLANKRAEEEARQQGFEGLQEGLYALFQTHVYHPPPIVDAKVPKNSFGNIDLFVDSMLPPGAVHIPYNGTAKVAKQLGIGFAEAIVGFEFRKHRSMPRMKGIVVAEEHGDLLLETFWTTEHQNAERAEKRKREKELKERRKKLSAAQIRARMRREYGHGAGVGSGASDDDEEDDMSDLHDDDDDDEEEEQEQEEDEQAKEGFKSTNDDGETDEEDLSAYRQTRSRRRRRGVEAAPELSAGGFLLEDDEEGEDEQPTAMQIDQPRQRRSRRQRGKDAAEAVGGFLPEHEDEGGEEQPEEDLSAYMQTRSNRRRRKPANIEEQDDDEGGGGGGFLVD